MAARKKSKTPPKRQYVRAKKRKGSEGGTVARRSVSVILLVLILVSIVFGIVLGFKWIGRQLYADNKRFEIQHLVISYTGSLNEDNIRDWSGLREGMNLWELSFDEIEQKLMSVSRIESVRLERKLPHTLLVEVKERVAVARIEGAASKRVPLRIDRYGHILPPKLKTDDLPLIKGIDLDLVPGSSVENEDVKKAIQIIGICESSSYLRNYVQLKSLDLKYQDFIDMRLNGSMEKEVRVRMPRFSLKPKLQKLASILKISQGQGRQVKEVDLTLDSAKVPVTYY